MNTPTSRKALSSELNKRIRLGLDATEFELSPGSYNRRKKGRVVWWLLGLNKIEFTPDVYQDTEGHWDLLMIYDLIARILRENLDQLDDIQRQRLEQFEELLATCPRRRSPR